MKATETESMKRERRVTGRVGREGRENHRGRSSLDGTARPVGIGE